MLGALIGGGLGLVGSIIGGNKADDAAQAQTDASNQSIQFQKDIYEQQKEILNPFLQFGQSQLGALGQAMKPIDREATLAAYYQSPEYQMQAGQARNQQLAASEAMGGLGSSTTGNALASIAPQLGQNYLSQQYAQQMDQFNKLMSGANMGLGAATGQAGFAGNLGSQVTNQLGNMGAYQAGNALAQGQAMQQGLGALGNIGATIAGAYF